MGKIVAIAGSNNKNSRTYRLLNLWLKRMSELDDSLQYEVLLLRDFNLVMCEGCSSCFYNGKCVLDQKDDMPFLREKLLESDVIIFSSPVYMHNMSGIMKNFIDRMAFFSHLLSLSGKFGFTLTTTSSSGEEMVSDMLRQMQISFGIKNVNNFVFKAVFDDEIISIDQWARISVEDLSYQLGFSDQRLEEKFRFFKEYYSMGKIDDSAFWSEFRFWQQPAVQQCASFQEFAMKYKQFQKPKIDEACGNTEHFGMKKR